jgi:hypothetical protein
MARKSTKKSSVKKKRARRTPTVFTDENLRIMRKLYPNTSNAELAKRFNTTPGTINWKASVLGLRKSKSYMTALLNEKRKNAQIALKKGRKKKATKTSVKKTAPKSKRGTKNKSKSKTKNKK